MGKLDGLKEKIEGVKAGLLEKLDKIAFIRKWREKRAAAAPANGTNPATTGPQTPAFSISETYQQGSTFTRLHVILIFLLALGAVAATVNAGIKIFRKFRSSAPHESSGKEISHGLEAMTNKVVENARLVSLGSFTSTVNTPAQKQKMMFVDVWVRMNDTEMAEYTQKNDTLVRDLVLNVFSEISQEPIDPLSENGKLAAKSRIEVELNRSLPKKNTVEEVFFQNLIVQ